MTHHSLTDVPAEATRIAMEVFSINASVDFADLRDEMTLRLLSMEFLTGDPETELFRRMLAVATMQRLAASIAHMVDTITTRAGIADPEPMEPPC